MTKPELHPLTVKLMEVVVEKMWHYKEPATVLDKVVRDYMVKSVPSVDSREELIMQLTEQFHDYAPEVADVVIQDRKKREVSVEEIYRIMEGTKCRLFNVDEEFAKLQSNGIYNLTLYSMAEAIVANLIGEK